MKNRINPLIILLSLLLSPFPGISQTIGNTEGYLKDPLTEDSIWMMPVKEASLDSCLKWVENNFQTIERNDLQQKLSQLQYSAAGTAYAPQLGVEGFGGWIWGVPIWGQNHNNSSWAWATGIGLEQKLWDRGESHRNRQMAKLGGEMSVAETQMQVRDLYRQTGELYFAVLMIEQQYELLKEQISILEKYRKLTGASVKNGIAPESAYKEFEISVLELRQHETELLSTRKNVRMAISMLCGKNLTESTFILPEMNLPETGKNLMNGNRPELILLEGKSAMLEYQAGGIGQFFPQISLKANTYFLGPQAYIGEQSFHHMISAGLHLQWKLDHKIYSASAGKKMLKIEHELLEQDKQNFILSANLDLVRNQGEIEKFRQLVENDQKIVKLRQELVEDIQKQYENGVLSSKDLIEALRQENQAVSQKNIHEMELMQSIFYFLHGFGNQNTPITR